MSLITCKECGAKIIQTAKFCPNCRSTKLPHKVGERGNIAIIFIALIGIFVILSKNQQSSSNTTTSGLQNDPQPKLQSHNQAEIFDLPSAMYKPYQYIDLSINNASVKTSSQPNQANNIVIESKNAEMLLETSNGTTITFVDVELKQTEPCSQSETFDSEKILRALKIEPQTLELAKTKIHYHTYYDHKRKLKIGVSCVADGMPISVMISKKYYMQ